MSTILDEEAQDRLIKFAEKNLKKIAKKLEELENFKWDGYARPNALKRSFRGLRNQPFDPDIENICIRCGKRYEYDSYFGRHLKQVCGLGCHHEFHKLNTIERLIFKFDLGDSVRLYNTRYYGKRFTELLINDVMFQKYINRKMKRWDKRDLARSYLES